MRMPRFCVFIPLLLSLLGCSGVSCPFTRPACCDNALFGCGPFDLPQGCSCSDYFSRSFSGSPISSPRGVIKRDSVSAVQDSTWRVALEKRSGDCSYLSNSIRSTLLIRSQGRQIWMKVVGYPRLRGVRSGNLMRARGQSSALFPRCTVAIKSSINLSTSTQGVANGAVEVTCKNSALSCSAQFSGAAQRVF